MNKVFLLAITLLLATVSLEAQERQILDKIIGIIDNQIVLQSEVEEQFRLMEAQQGTVPPEARCLIADQLFVQKLLLAQADKDSIVVSEEEVNQQIDSRIEYILSMMGGDYEQFENYYGMSVLEMKERYRIDMEQQLLTERMQGTVMETVSVTPSEVREFFNSIPSDSLPYFNAEVEMGEIVLKPKVNEVELKKAYDRLVDIRRGVVEEGADFAKLATENSDDPGSAAKGGSLGWVKRGVMVPEFEAALFKLKNKEYSPIIKTEFGYHFIQSVERRGNTVYARHILIKPEITFNDIDLAKAKLDTIRDLILTDSITFTQAVKRYSEDEQSKNNAGLMLNPKTGTTLFEVGDLPTEVYFAIDEMKVGDISEPLEFYDARQEQQFRIVKLRSFSDPHKANLNDDYAKIQTAAIERKKGQHMSDWIDSKVVKTYIQLEPEYNQCPNMKKWTEKGVAKAN